MKIKIAETEKIFIITQKVEKENKDNSLKVKPEDIAITNYDKDRIRLYTNHDSRLINKVQIKALFEAISKW